MVWHFPRYLFDSGLPLNSSNKYSPSETGTYGKDKKSSPSALTASPKRKCVRAKVGITIGTYSSGECFVKKNTKRTRLPPVCFCDCPLLCFVRLNCLTKTVLIIINSKSIQFYQIFLCLNNIHSHIYILLQLLIY